MSENVSFGFLQPEESKPTDLWLPLFLALTSWGQRSSSPGIKVDVSIEKVHISEAKISTDK